MLAASMAAGVATGAPQALAELSRPEGELLRNAQMWSARGRNDLARQSVDKLLVLQPSSPQGLAMQGNLALQDGQPELAQRLLQQLRQQHPMHPATADLATLVRIHGSQQEQLTRMRLMARAGRRQEALELARALFPQGPPALGGLALEYYRLLATEPQEAPRVQQALGALYQRTGNGEFLLAQIEQQQAQGAPAAEGARALEQLASDPTADPLRLRDLWRRTLERLEPAPASLQRLQAYLQRYPDDPAVLALLQTQQAAIEREERWRRDPVRLAQQAALRALEAGDLSTAQQQLQAALARRPNDADTLGTLGLVHLRQGQHLRASELFAQALRHSGAQRWRDLQATAQFWGALAQAGEASEQGDLVQAARWAQQALQLQPGQVQALSTLADIHARQGDNEAALQLYAQVLHSEPNNGTALRGWVEVLIAQGRAQEALARLDVLVPTPGAGADADTLASLRASALTALAEAQLQGGQPAAAVSPLQGALALQPLDPWLRHRLARTQLQLQRPGQALQTMDEGVALAPQAAQMRYARALIRSATDNDSGALQDLQAIPEHQRSDGMRELLRAAAVGSAVAAAAQPGAAAAVLLAEAEGQAQDDAALLLSVANAWFRLDQPASAVAVFERLAQRVQPLPDAAALEYAGVLGRARADAPLSALLGPLLGREGWSPQQAQRLLQLHTEHLVRRTEAAVAAGDKAGARQLAGTPLLAHGAVAPAQRAQARGSLLLAAEDWPGAARVLSQALDELPQDAEVRLALGQALARSNQPTELERAREQARWLAAHQRPQTLDQQLALLRLWQRIGTEQDLQQARALAHRLLDSHPQNTEVLLHAARMEQSQDRYGPALAYYRQAGTHPASSAQERQAIADNIRGIEARRQSWVEVGMARIGKSATPGVSSLRGWEVPTVAWTPRGYEGHHFLHVDQVRLNAGALPGDAAEVLDYGQVGAWPAAQYPSLPGVPRGHGVNLGVGYRGRGLEWDVGLTGLGFAVTRWVGGLSWGEWSEQGSWRVELARRPITGSLLSYAGVRDPITGQTWGGVVASGVSGRISRPWGGASTSLSAGYALLQGRNVRSNTRLQVRAAIDRDVYSSRQLGTVNLGAALALWRYGHDLSEYTWGHGGYYSPRNYASLSVPLEWGGRRGPLSWQLRGALSLSRSSSAASDYYPGQPQLQAQALALGREPTHAASASTGVGRSLRAALEYQLTPASTLGALLSLDRSAYYAPTQVMLYLRVLLGPVRASRPERPRPLQPYADF